MADEETHRLNVDPEHQDDPYSEPIDTKPLHTQSRQGFIRKVYSILATQLVVTSIFVIIAITQPTIGNFVKKNLPLLFVSFTIAIVSMYSLACYPTVARRVPINYVLLFVFTVAESYLVASISSHYSKPHVMMAAILTAVLVTGLTIYAFVAEIDYTKLLPYLFIIGLVLLATSIVAFFVRVPLLHTIISALLVIFFGIYLIIDTQLILGKHSNALEMDDYIMAAMLLYIDIITIFLEILKLMGNKN